MHRTLLKRLRSERGITLVEMLVAATMALFVLGAAGMILVMAARNQPAVAERSSDIQEGQVLQERIGREIRQGYRIENATASSMQLFTYQRVAACGSGTPISSTQPAIPCRVSYACSGGTCNRSETNPEGTTSPGVQQVVTGLASDEVFAYSPSAAAPSYVTLTFAFTDSREGGETVTLQDGFELRNR